MNSFQGKLLLVLMSGWAVGALYAGLVSGTLPLIRMELNLSPGEAGAVLSSWLAGMLLGALVFGYIADKLGRRVSLILSTVFMGVFTPLSAVARSWLDLVFYRVLAGAGNAGYMVTASVLMSEYAATKNRGRSVAILESAWAVGWLAALVLSRVLAPAYGWRSVFLTTSTALLLVPAFHVGVPESLRFLFSKGRVEEARELAMRFKVELPSTVYEEKAKLSDILAKPFAKRTAMLWVHWFVLVLTYWGIFLWLTDILYSRGIPFVKSLDYSIAITLAQVPGYLSTAYLIEVVGRKKVLSVYMLGAGAASIGMWLATTEVEVLLFGLLVSFFNLGAWGVTYAYTPELYPTKLRGTGSGWANAFGRVGGILGPYLAGALMQAYGNPLAPFSLFAVGHIVSAVVVAALGVETKGKTLEEISK
ncbi:MAG: MFS transporter [Thermofilaceae archaeon]|nr:MFS transporter [Thermofilaceae archaeon]MCX8180428.1 MFS transporter [Thermofilaceae archaeon]MDW8003375.1 MFS transporter [Thermofilaceae archaeon]